MSQQQQSVRRSITRNMDDYLHRGQLIRHVYNGHISYVRYYTKCIMKGSNSVDKHFLILCFQNDDKGGVINGFNEKTHTHYKSLSGFATAHKNAVNPYKKHGSNGWKECEIQMNTGIWMSIARVYP